MLISFFFFTCDACIILHTIGGLTSVAVLFDWIVFSSSDFSLRMFLEFVVTVCRLPIFVTVDNCQCCPRTRNRKSNKLICIYFDTFPATSLKHIPNRSEEHCCHIFLTIFLTSHEMNRINFIVFCSCHFRRCCRPPSHPTYDTI